MLKLVDTSYDIWIHTGLTSFGLDGHWTPFGEGRPQDSNGQQQASDSLGRLFVTTSQRARSGNDRETIRDNKKEALEKSKPAPSHRATSFYPVIHLLCSLFQAFLKSLSYTARLLELLQQLPGVIQLLRVHDGIQGSQIAIACLFQGWHWKLRQTLLMGQVATGDPCHWHWFYQATGFHHAGLDLKIFQMLQQRLHYIIQHKET